MQTLNFNPKSIQESIRQATNSIEVIMMTLKTYQSMVMKSKACPQVESRVTMTRMTPTKVSFILFNDTFFSVLKNTYKLDANNGHVSHTKLLLYMDKKHARETEIVNGQSTVRKRRICATRTGWHCCCPKFRKSDFAQYGMGVTIYF